jgi:hypothetical protein
MYDIRSMQATVHGVVPSLECLLECCALMHAWCGAVTANICRYSLLQHLQCNGMHAEVHAYSHAVDRSYWDFFHFVECQNARMQLHAMHSSNPKQTLAHLGMYMARAVHTYAPLLGSRRNTGVILGSWVAIYISGTLRSCATAEVSRSIGMDRCVYSQQWFVDKW